MAEILIDANLRLGASGPIFASGSGSPEGVITAPTGSLWLRTDGGTGTVFYIKNSGSGATGWASLGNQLDVPFILPPVGEYMLTTNGAGGAAAATLAGAANRIDLFPYVPRADFSINQLVVNCTTAVAAAQGKLLIYSSDSDQKADALLYESGILDFSTTGQKPATPSLSLKKGETYWFGIRHSSTATLSAWATAATPDINGGTAISTSARKVLRRTLAFGTAAPGTWGHVSSEINPGPATAIWMRRA